MDRKRAVSIDDKHYLTSVHPGGEQKRSRGRPRQSKFPIGYDMPLLHEPVSVTSGTEKLTQQIIAALMTNDPLELDDILFVTRTQFTAEAVQGILDVLYVLGVIVRLNHSDSKEDNTTPQQKAVLYTLRGFCRCSEGLDARRLNTVEHTEARIASVEALEKRIIALHTMTGGEMSVKDRTALFKSHVQSSLQENKLLGLDPLYAVLHNTLASMVPAAPL